MKYFILAIIALGLCGCKGRRAFVPESNGDTVEVVVSQPERNGTQMESDTIVEASVAEETVAPATQAGEAPAVAPEQVTETGSTPPSAGMALPAGDPNGKNQRLPGPNEF